MSMRPRAPVVANLGTAGRDSDPEGTLSARLDRCRFDINPDRLRDSHRVGGCLRCERPPSSYGRSPKRLGVVGPASGVYIDL